MKIFSKLLLTISLLVAFMAHEKGHCDLQEEVEQNAHPSKNSAIPSEAIPPEAFGSAIAEHLRQITDNAAEKQPNSQKVFQTSTHGDYGAFAAFGELGYKNFRGSGTYGVYFTPHQRFKVSGEWLTQDLKYHFLSGQHHKWVSQYAIGAEYQYLFCNRVFQSIEAGSAYVHAFDYKLSKKQIAPSTLLSRRIAGSDGALSFLGTTLKLWKCATLAASADYDWVQYHRIHESNKLANGFGGSVNFVQQFARDFSLSLLAEFREPYNSYRGVINWNRLFSRWGINLGIFGNITDGKKGVPDIKTIGAQLGLSFGGKGNKCLPCSEKQKNGCHSRSYCDASAWASTPAVYVPVVLSIADQALVVTCSPPTSTTIPDAGQFPESFFYYDVSVFFSSTLPLTYSQVGLPPGDVVDPLVLDPVTGVISGTTSTFGVYDVTITATSSCGSTSQSFLFAVAF